MNLTKCKNGHYYDADKYSGCPHCGNNNNTDDDVTVNMESAGYGGPDNSHTVSFWEGTTEQFPFAPGSLADNREAGNGPVPLSQAIKEAAASPAAGRVDGDDNKTVSYYGGVLETEPVVGWLVCIEGKLLGKSFGLKNGKNFIGRSLDMDIVLEGDASVSRNRHAIVTYEPKGKMFFAQPGESRELFYVNEQVVLMNVTLKNRDIICVGNTRLMFIPLCGPDFSWDDLKNRGIKGDI